jgi:hypothetical protein
MRRRIRCGTATWLGVAALLCQILLPFGLAQLADATDPGWSAQTAHHEHYHDPGLANSLGLDWASGHSHAGDTPSGRVRFDLAYLTPFTVIDPPTGPAAVLRWVAFVADKPAPAPSGADSFTRPLPRAPPLPA